MKKLSSIIHYPLSIGFLLFAFCFLLFATASPAHAMLIEGAGVGSDGGTADPAIQDLETHKQNVVQSMQTGAPAAEWYKTFDFRNTVAAAAWSLNPPQEFGAASGIGAIPAMSKMIASTIGNPPANTGVYIADIMDNMGIVTPAYAQDEGTGWTALNSILTIWKAFRNIAYLGFVIIFVIVGFMIMFRAQINPQTVVTIQAALPKIVFTLLLVTFSYAIASLMIDLIYVLIYLMVGVLSTFGVIQSSGRETVINLLLEENAFMIIKLLGPKGAAMSAADAVGDLVEGIVDVTILDRVFNWISDSLAYVIIAVAILISLFKLFFQLLMAYIGIIFSVIFAPITLLFNALPNSNSFSSWLKGLFANTIIFPVVALLFILAGALTGAEGFMPYEQGVGYSGDPGRQLVLPFVGGGFDTGAIQALIGIGCIMIMPKIVEMVQKMLGIEGGIMGAVSAPLAGLAQVPMAIGKTVGSLAVSTGIEEWRHRRLVAALRPKPPKPSETRGGRGTERREAPTGTGPLPTEGIIS